MQDELSWLTERLVDDGQKTVAFFVELPDQAWDQQVYASGVGWKVRQILGHFVSAERAYTHYLQDVLRGGVGVPSGFDIDEFNESETPSFVDVPPTALLDEYRTARQELIRMASSLSPNDLDRRGRHPWFGDVDVRFMLKLAYRHQMLHVRDIRKALASGEPLPAQGDAGSAPAP